MKSCSRTIIHIDVVDFPIAVERVLEPKLRQRPVVIAVETTTRSLVFSASNEARQQGIFRGMPLYLAKKQCTDLQVLPPNEELYRRMTEAMMSVLEKFTPIYEPLRFGHAYLDMTGSTRLFGDVKDAAVSIQREMSSQLSLSSSAGVAANKLVSKVASDFIAGHGVRCGLYDVRRGEEKRFLAPLSVRYLPGVRNKVSDELHDLNVRIIHELARIDVEHLQMIFGRFGVLLHQRALGIDPRPVQPLQQTPEIVETEQLDEDSNDYFFLSTLLHRMLARAARRLRTQNLRSARMVLEIRYSDMQQDAAQQRFAPINTEIELMPVLRSLLHVALRRRIRVRRLTLRLCDLRGAVRQLSLFENNADLRIKAVTAAMDKICGRFGDDAIRFGCAA